MGRRRIHQPIVKYPEFAERLRGLMDKHRLNQSELARLIPCRPLLVSHWFNGVRVPTLLRHRQRLTEIFSITGDWLFFGKNSNSTKIPTEVIDSVEEMKKLFKKLEESLEKYPHEKPSE